MFIQKYKNYLITIYILLFIFGFFFVRSVLNDESIKVSEKDSNGAKEEEVKPAKVSLNIIYNGTVEEYSARLKNTDSVLDLLEHLRSSEGFWYEKTAYTYGTEVNDINNVKSPEGYTWKVFLGDEDITYEIAERKLVDKEAYEIKLVPIQTAEPQ